MAGDMEIFPLNVPVVERNVGGGCWYSGRRSSSNVSSGLIGKRSSRFLISSVTGHEHKLLPLPFDVGLSREFTKRCYEGNNEMVGRDSNGPGYQSF